jgi:hypothetical protein
MQNSALRWAEVARRHNTRTRALKRKVGTYVSNHQRWHFHTLLGCTHHTRTHCGLTSKWAWSEAFVSFWRWRDCYLQECRCGQSSSSAKGCSGWKLINCWKFLVAACTNSLAYVKGGAITCLLQFTTLHSERNYPFYRHETGARCKQPCLLTVQLPICGLYTAVSVMRLLRLLWNSELPSLKSGNAISSNSELPFLKFGDATMWYSEFPFGIRN